MVQVASNLTIVDLTLRGVSPGTYHATVREAGDISEGPESTGGVFEAVKAKQEGSPCRGVFDTVEADKGGIGSIFLDRPIQIWELIGRSIVVSRVQDGKFDKNDPDTLVGVIARSAGKIQTEVQSLDSISDDNKEPGSTIRQYAAALGKLCGKKGLSKESGACCDFYYAKYEAIVPASIRYYLPCQIQQSIVRLTNPALRSRK